MRSDGFASQTSETRAVAGFLPTSRRHQWRSDRFGLTTVTNLLRSTSVALHRRHGTKFKMGNQRRKSVNEREIQIPVLTKKEVFVKGLGSTGEARRILFKRNTAGIDHEGNRVVQPGQHD